MAQDRTQIARDIVNTYSKADWNGLKSLLTPDAIYDEIGSQRKVQSPDAIVQTLQGWKKTMTDSGGTVTNAFASGDLVALEVVWQGTQDGPFPGPAGTIPPSGKHQKTPAVMIVRFQGDKVAEIRHYFDMLAFLSQIGALPAPATR